MGGNGRQANLFSEVAARRHGFQVYLIEGAAPLRSREEARARTIIKLAVVRGADCGGQRVFHLYGPPGQPVPVPHYLQFLPSRPPFSDLRLRVAVVGGVPVWKRPEPLLWTNS